MFVAPTRKYCTGTLTQHVCKRNYHPPAEIAARLTGLVATITFSCVVISKIVSAVSTYVEQKRAIKKSTHYEQQTTMKNYDHQGKNLQVSPEIRDQMCRLDIEQGNSMICCDGVDEHGKPKTQIVPQFGTVRRWE